jgi:NADH dehydrogenase
MTFDQAVRNTTTLFDCARQAGINKIVHIGVTRAREDSPLAYYAGKARQERALEETGISFAILRPTLVYGPGDILVNNIAWLMRRFPAFPIFGSGEYRLQPVFVEDLASLAIEAAAAESSGSEDVIGPEVYTFGEFAALIAAHVRPGLLLVRVPPWAGIAAGRLIGWAVGDVILTRDELRGLMDETLTSDRRPNGTTRFSEWIAAHQDRLGRRYASELARHFAPSASSS